MVIPFNVSCGHCFMCNQGLQSQCETTQVREYNSGAADPARGAGARPSVRPSGREGMEGQSVGVTVASTRMSSSPRST